VGVQRAAHARAGLRDEGALRPRNRRCLAEIAPSKRDKMRQEELVKNCSKPTPAWRNRAFRQRAKERRRTALSNSEQAVMRLESGVAD
jgi:hypothetical protein